MANCTGCQGCIDGGCADTPGNADCNAKCTNLQQGGSGSCDCPGCDPTPHGN
jgi:hypothetical protein